MSKEGVTFRRIKGRIIPIRLKPHQQEMGKGATIAAAGLGVASAGGQIYKKTVVASASGAVKAFTTLEKAYSKFGPAQMSFGDIGRRAKMQQASANMFRKAQGLAKASGFVRKASPVIGAGLIAYGAVKAINAMPKDKRKKLRPEVAAGGGAAVAYLAPKAYDAAKGAFEAGMHGKTGMTGAAKTNWSKFSPAIKSGLAKLLKARF